MIELGKKKRITTTPCLRCGKTLRWDYDGLCMDCADELGISEMFKTTKQQRIDIVTKDYNKNKWYFKVLFPKSTLEAILVFMHLEK